MKSDQKEKWKPGDGAGGPEQERFQENAPAEKGLSFDKKDRERRGNKQKQRTSGAGKGLLSGHCEERLGVIRLMEPANILQELGAETKGPPFIMSTDSFVDRVSGPIVAP